MVHVYFENPDQNIVAVNQAVKQFYANTLSNIY